MAVLTKSPRKRRRERSGGKTEAGFVYFLSSRQLSPLLPSFNAGRLWAEAQGMGARWIQRALGFNAGWR